MAVGGHVLVEAAAPLLGQVAQVEDLDDGAGAQVEVLLHQGREAVVVEAAGAEALHQDAHGLGHADRVAELHFHLAGQAGGHQGLGHVAGRVGSRAVHLGGVLAGEGAAAVAGVAAVGVHDDLAAGEARIPLGTAHHELAGGVHQEAGGRGGAHGLQAGLERQVGGGGQHHVGPEVGGDPFAHRLLFRHPIDLGGVLGGDQDRVDRHGPVVVIDHAHLGLAVGQQVLEAAVVAHLGQAAGQPVGQADRQGHQLRRFIAGVAEHDPLVAGADAIEGIAVVVVGLVHALGDVGGLLVEGHQHGAAVGIEAAGAGAVVADALDHAPHQGVEVHPGRGGDLAGDQAQARVHHGFAGHPAGGILLQQGIQHRITDLIADLVGMALGHRFRGEDVTSHPVGCQIKSPSLWPGPRPPWGLAHCARAIRPSLGPAARPQPAACTVSSDQWWMRGWGSARGGGLLQPAM